MRERLNDAMRGARRFIQRNDYAVKAKPSPSSEQSSAYT